MSTHSHTDRTAAFEELRRQQAAEAEEYGPDIELARLRLRQATERIVGRFPATARDGQLASILEGLGDALGAGPEATDPHYAEAQETDIWRKQLLPVLWVVVEASTNVVLELTTPHGRVLSRVLVSAVELGGTLGHAAAFARAAADEAEGKRMAGIDDRRRSEGRLTKSEAVEWLIAKGMARWQAVSIAENVYRGNAADGYGMRFEGGYWCVPVNTEQTAR
jgi:hypothetical protein